MTSLPFFEQMLNYLVEISESYGLLGYFFLMIIQAIIAPIPSEALLIIGGGLYGTLIGGFVGSVGETVGAVFSFKISKKGGRPLAKKLLGKNALKFSDRWFSTYGAKAVLLGRLIPVIPFDAVSYGAGLTKMKFKPFIIATAIGSLPRSFFYAWLGQWVTDKIIRDGFVNSFLLISIIIVSLIIITLATHKIIKDRLKK